MKANNAGSAAHSRTAVTITKPVSTRGSYGRYAREAANDDVETRSIAAELDYKKKDAVRHIVAE